MTSWSDSYSESSKTEEEVNLMALTNEKVGHRNTCSRVINLSSDNDAEVTTDEIVKNYYLLNEKWLDVIDHNKMLNQNITDLKLEKSDL